MDPDGKDLTIVYDFTGSGLTLNQQLAVAYGVRSRFINAGVQNVRSVFRRQSIPKGVVGKHKVAPVSFKKSISGTSRGSAMGSTPIPYNASRISSSKIPANAEQAVTHTVNVIVHEVGHQAGLATTLQGGHEGAAPGSIMATPEQEQDFSEGVLEFSPGQAEQLKMSLNEPEENEELPEPE